MATQSLINPFSDFGAIVYGDRFIGRKKALCKISQRVLGEAYGNLAIMGLPRIGKSSLAWQGIMTKKTDLLEKKTIPIFFQSGSCRTTKDFFKQMMLSLHQEMLLSYEDGKYLKSSSRLIDNIQEIDDSSFTLIIINYFKLVKRLGYKVIFILDEFDSVEIYFDLAAFQLLRELSYNPEIKLCLVTCSRKTIQEIEANNGAISNFFGTFIDLRLGMFDNDDMTDYWKRAESYGLNDTYKQVVDYYVGRHPFLLDLINDFFIKNEQFDFNKGFTSNDLVAEIQLALWNQLKLILETLSKEKLQDKAIQLILGPVYNVTKVEEEKLLKYEFVKVVDNSMKIDVLGRVVGAQTTSGSYICFSNYFTQLLDQEFTANIDYWPLWTETEKKIRELIKIYVNAVFTNDWETEIYAKYGSSKDWSDQFDLLKSTRSKTKRLFPSASSNLIDYTLTRDMYNVFMAKAWNDWFGKVFSGTKKEWAAKFNYLADIRNPMAHNNREFITKDQISIAEEYCKEIIRVIGEWEAKQE